MELHLALYDPSWYNYDDKSYWTWRSAEIPKNLLNNCYYDFLIQHKPEQNSATDLHGGMIYLSDWVVVYRFFNGGRDTHGRPGRYIILTGWIKRSEITDEVPVDVLTASLFESLSNTIPPCPVPKPNSLDCVVRTTFCNSSSFQLTGGKYEFPAGTPLSEAIASFFSLNKHTGQYQLIVHQSKTESVLTIQKIEAKPVQPIVTHQPSIVPDSTPVLPPVESPQVDKSKKILQISLMANIVLLGLLVVSLVTQYNLQSELKQMQDKIHDLQQQQIRESQMYQQQIEALKEQLEASRINSQSETQPIEPTINDTMTP